MSFLETLQKKSANIQSKRSESFSDQIVQANQDQADDTELEEILEINEALRVSGAVDRVQVLNDGNVRQSELGSTDSPIYYDRPNCSFPDSYVICDIVTARNRLDISFPDGKPEQEIIDALKFYGFRWNRASQCWFHQNSEENREILKTLFGMIFDDSDPLPVKIEEKPAEESQAPASPEFQKYKDQVDTLIDVLGVRPADLMLLAIDALYREKIDTMN